MCSAHHLAIAIARMADTVSCIIACGHLPVCSYTELRTHIVLSRVLSLLIARDHNVHYFRPPCGSFPRHGLLFAHWKFGLGTDSRRLTVTAYYVEKQVAKLS